MTENVIKIDGKDYDANAFSAEQKMLLDQTQVALQVFTNQLIGSLKPKE